MLARLDPRVLDRVWFPLGEQTKADTRTQARAAGLEAAGRAESQEVCFLAGGDYRDFLARRGLEPKPGAIVAEDGTALGRHDGLWRYTPGQRKGLGVSAPEPLYALRAEPRTNTLVVGPRRALATTRVAARGRLFVPATRVDARLRHRSPARSADVVATNGGFRLHLHEPAFGVARGQAAVLYDGDVVVGSGLVTSARAD